MPIHIEQLHSEIAVLQGDLPLTPEQVERLVALVAARVAEHERASKDDRRIPRRSVIPKLETRG
jgi:hypothetical protein